MRKASLSRNGAQCQHVTLPCKSSARRLSNIVHAEPTPKSVNLGELHEELLKQIEDRKRHQSQLLAKLNQLTQQSAAVQATPAPPSSPPPSPAYKPKPSTASPLPAFIIEPMVSPPPPPPAPMAQVAQVAPAPPPVPEKKEPLAGPNVMNIVFVGAECAPWSKTGGLGDVMGSLPKAMARRGHRVMVVAPRYAVYDDAWETGVRRMFKVLNQDVEVGYFHAFVDGVDFLFVDHASFQGRGKEIYGGSREDLMFRCALLCKAALEAVWYVPCGGIPYGDNNLCFVANDWHTALLPVFLQAHYRDYNKMTYSRCVFVIHNMAHQGRGPYDEANLLELNDHYRGLFYLDDPVGGPHMNIMKAGLHTSQRLIAVSRGYAWECQTPEGGWGLHQVLQESGWKTRGIVNGIDYNDWSPAVDKFLMTDGYVNYDINTMVEGKAACKAALQRELGLPEDPNVPMFGFIGRLDYQKGVDLIRDNYDYLMAEGCQLVMLGSGREDLETALRDMESRNKSKCRCWVGFSVAMSHRITAAVDMLLMPSRFEPCGLNQLYAMAYGTVPIVHAVGGLRDTVQNYNPFENTGTGWTFDRAESHKLREAISFALTTYRQHKDSYRGIQQRCMGQDLSWDEAARQYEEVLVEAKFQW